MNRTIDDESDIRERVTRRYAAVVARDWEGFVAHCHPQLRYTHSNGLVDTLDSYLVKLREGFYVYHRIDHPVHHVTIAGDTAVVIGEMNAQITSDGVEKAITTTAIAVWVRVDEQWVLLAHNPTVAE